MNGLTDSLITLSIPVTAVDRQQAEQFASQQLTPEKATQVYRNTIAVLVGDRYLQMLAIASKVEAGQSWNRVDRSLKNVADLYLPDVQKSLECRAVLSGETHCMIPEEVQDDRIGYLILQLDEPYYEGKILGFVPRVSIPNLPLSYLQPVDTLIDHLIPAAPIHLGQWLQGKFEEIWQPRLDLLKPPKRPALLMSNVFTIDTSSLKTEALRRSIVQLYQQASLAEQIEFGTIDPNPIAALVHLMQTTQKDEIRWQAAELLWELDPNHPASPVMSARDIGLYLGGNAIAFMVGVLPKLDRRRLILLRLYPIQSEPCLPKELKLAVFDDQGNQLVELESRDRDQYIQFKLTADPKDTFEVRVSLHDASVVESFVV